MVEDRSSFETSEQEHRPEPAELEARIREEQYKALTLRNRRLMAQYPKIATMIQENEYRHQPRLDEMTLGQLQSIYYAS